MVSNSNEMKEMKPNTLGKSVKFAAPSDGASQISQSMSSKNPKTNQDEDDKNVDGSRFVSFSGVDVNKKQETVMFRDNAKPKKIDNDFDFV